MDMFNMFFGGGGGFPGGGPHGGRSSNKSKPIVHKLGVTLEELYNGKTRKLAVTREICCEKCNGKGGSKVEKCQSCRGSGTYSYKTLPGYRDNAFLNFFPKIFRNESYYQTNWTWNDSANAKSL